MFTRTSTVKELQRQSAAALLHATIRAKDARDDVKELRKEVRRLTDVIIQLKREGQSLAPEHSDARWVDGKYNFSEFEEGAPRRDPGLPVPVARPDSKVDEIEAEIRAELEAALNEE